MDVQTIVNEFNKKAGDIAPIGGVLKFKLDEQVFVIDGSGSENILSQEDKDADCTISTTMKNFIKLQKGELNPMMAVMSGKVKIKGDMGLAMQLQSLL